MNRRALIWMLVKIPAGAIRKPHVAPDQAATLRHFEGMIGADEDANVVLMRAQ